MSLFEEEAPARKRPIRTYGRRTPVSDIRESQSPRKRRKTEEPAVTPSSPTTALSPTPQLPQLSQLPPSTQPPEPKRGSILAFFKPAAAVDLSSTSLIPSSDLLAPASEDALPTTTPPSSPPPVYKSRKRRRLTTRPTHERTSPLPTEETTLVDVNRDSTLEATTDSMVVAIDDQEFLPEITEPVLSDYAEPQAIFEGRSALSVLLANALSARANAAKPEEMEKPEEGKKDKEPRGRRGSKKKELVQTRLNLLTKPGPGFTICKTCGLLYNHLNDKDRKDHQRWHARRSRARSKQGEEETGCN